MLGRNKILNAVRSGEIVIDPFIEDDVKVNSVDAVLGPWFWYSGVIKDGHIVYEPFYVHPGQKVSIPRYGQLLGMIDNIIRSDVYIPQVYTKSTREREMVDMCKSAGLGDVGFCGRWTIEITTSISPKSEELPSLTVGVSRVAQAVFHTVDNDGVPLELYSSETGHQYNDDTWPLCMLPKDYRAEWLNFDFEELKDNVYQFPTYYPSYAY